MGMAMIGVVNVPLFNKEVKKFNNTLSDPEKLKRFRLVPDEWSTATGELSPTLKLRRKQIEKEYKEILEEIYVTQTI
ncbi:MAG: hypothetical protein KAX05_03805 [Bacteroidales bacterium]|nr:hypothetical protein [Bacteroidales bacterium]